MTSVLATLLLAVSKLPPSSAFSCPLHPELPFQLQSQTPTGSPTNSPTAAPTGSPTDGSISAEQSVQQLEGEFEHLVADYMKDDVGVTAWIECFAPSAVFSIEWSTCPDTPNQEMSLAEYIMWSNAWKDMIINVKVEDGSSHVKVLDAHTLGSTFTTITDWDLTGMGYSQLMGFSQTFNVTTEWNDQGKILALHTVEGDTAVPCVALETLFQSLMYVMPKTTIAELSDDSKVTLLGFNAVSVVFVAVFGAFTLLMGILIGVSFKLVSCKKQQYAKVYPSDALSGEDEQEAKVVPAEKQELL